MRRATYLAIAAALVVGTARPGAQAADARAIVVTLLGTGTPNPRVDRMGPSTLVEAGGLALLFDVGRGTTIRLAQARHQAAAIDAVFLTHLHSDHVNGLPDLWLTGWLPPFGGRRVPLVVIGPTGTRAMTDGLTQAYAEDIRMRTVEERLPAQGVAFSPREFDTDRVVFEQAGVRVTTVAVDHGGELRPAYGYRVSAAGRSVVISGDTRYSDRLARHAAGADVIVHEVIGASPGARALPAARFRLEHHASPSDAARVFQQAKPRLGVFTHLALIPDERGAVPSDADLLAEVAATYPGLVVVGEDLMRIVVGDTVEVLRPGQR